MNTTTNTKDGTGFLPKLGPGAGGNTRTTDLTMLRKKTVGGNTSTGPFYKKPRGYASSQLEMRRDSTNPRSAHNNPLLGLSYDRS